MATGKRKKYIPAYIAVYGTVFLIAVLIVVIICQIAGCSNKKPETETTSSTKSTAAVKTEAKTTVSSQSKPKDTISQSSTQSTQSTQSSTPSTSDNWALYVIGNNNPLPENFSVETKSVAGERMLDKRCADYAIQMLNDAASQKVGLFVTSAYRSIQKQKENMESYINSLMAQGYNKEEAAAQARKEIAVPGCSEHNAGLAMDIVSDDYWSNHSDLDESFEKLPQYKWLIDNSWKYGFILSYPKGKENITGFIYEPWHYRFVGLEHAKKIHEVYEQTGEFLTVNEYIEQYSNH